MGLKLQDVPAAAGLRWVTQAFREYFQHPVAYTSVFAAFIVTLNLIALLPYAGHLAVLMAPPLLTLTFILATSRSQHGGLILPGVFTAPWKQREPDRRRPLLGLLLAHAALTAAAFWLCELADGGAFFDWLEALQKWTTANMQATPPAEPSAMPEVPGAMAGGMMRAASIALLSLPFWFAPALVFWGGQGPAQAMFSSALALWRARVAFVAYALGWFVAAMVSITAASVLLAVVGPAFGGLLILPIALMLTSAFYVSLYFSFRDCFGEPD